jgi:hypothetical protein
MFNQIKIRQPFILTPANPNQPPFKVLNPIRHWLDQVAIENANLAHLICRLIPTQCPFERNISFFGNTFYIPPLCKLNPLYEELISLRFRALCYLADRCQEDVRRYC